MTDTRERTPGFQQDQDAADVVRTALHRDGVTSLCGVKIERVEVAGDIKILHYSCGNEKQTLEVDHILVGVGRAPNVEGIGLEAAGVKFDVRTPMGHGLDGILPPPRPPSRRQMGGRATRSVRIRR